MFLAVVLVTMLSAVSVAFAATNTTQQWDSVDVIAQDDPSESILLVSGVLPEDVKLPAQVELSLPAGAQLFWAGEVLGGSADQDPSVTPTKATRDGMDVYTFTLSKGRRGQLEATVPAAATFDGSAYNASLKWSSSTPVPTVRLSVRMPQGSSVTTPAQGAIVEPAGEGASYYTQTFDNVKPSDPLALVFGYKVDPAAAAAAAAPAAATPAQSGTNNVVPIVLALGAVAGAIGLFVAVSRKMSSATAAHDDERDDEDAEDATSNQPDTDSAGSQPSEGADEGGSPDGEAAARRLSPPAIMAIAIATVVVVAVIVLNLSSGPQIADGKMTKSFGGEASACTSATIALVPNQGVDLARSGEKVIDSFTGMQGIGSVTLYVGDPRVEVEFCESTTNEQAIRDALASSGLVSF